MLFSNRNNTSSISESPKQYMPKKDFGKYCSMAVRLKKDNDSEDEALIEKERGNENDSSFFTPGADQSDVIQYEVLHQDLEEGLKAKD